jgi:hypothetical protein
MKTITKATLADCIDYHDSTLNFPEPCLYHVASPTPVVILRRIRKRWKPKVGEQYWQVIWPKIQHMRNLNQDMERYEVAFKNQEAARKAHELLQSLDPETGEPMEGG